jgi:hypothetical protein
VVALEDRAPDRCRDVSAAPARGLGPGVVLGLGFGLVPGLGFGFRFEQGFVFAFVFVFGLRFLSVPGPGLGGARGMPPRTRRHRVLLTLELGHQGAHGAEVKLAEIRTRGSMREQSLRPLDELHVFFACLELDLVALRLQPRRRVSGQDRGRAFPRRGRQRVRPKS